ncbi:MAG TPA: glycosyltransferase [Bryobacteraceae bacterium]|nr:glycosyltransferase [Bryobacteraceae bacterium]
MVVPCYNEANRLRSTEFLSFLQTHPWCSLLFVDDGSKDRTVDLLLGLQQQLPQRISVLRQPVNGGKGAAVLAGMEAMLSRADADAVGYWDADLATPLDASAEMRDVLINVPEIQMVFGSRVKLLGRHIERLAVRHYLGRIFATAVSTMLQLPIYDTQCGAKLFRVSDDLRRVLKLGPFLSRWVFDVEIIARFIQLRGVAWVARSIYELPLRQWADIGGSKIRPTDFVTAIGDVIRIRQQYLRSHRHL